MARLFRLALIFGGLFGAYGVAGFLFERRHPAFAHAAILVGVALFGAGIMLVAQMYHIEGDPPGAVLTWALGALLAGVVLKSDPALALAMLLMGLWSGWAMRTPATCTGPSCWAGARSRRQSPGGLGAGAASGRRRPEHLDHQPGLRSLRRAWAWRRGRHRTARHGGCGLAAPVVLDERRALGRSPAVAYGMTIAFAGLFALQFVEQRPARHPDPSRYPHAGAGPRRHRLSACATGSAALLWLGYGGFSHRGAWPLLQDGRHAARLVAVFPFGRRHRHPPWRRSPTGCMRAPTVRRLPHDASNGAISGSALPRSPACRRPCSAG